MTINQQKELAEKVISKVMNKYNVDRESALIGTFDEKMRYDASDIMQRIGIQVEVIELLQMEFYQD
jgi:hypothetical protein